MKAMIAVTTTAGTKKAETRSARRLDRRPGALRLGDHLDDARQRRLRADLLRRHHEAAVPVDRPAGDGSPAVFSTGIGSPVIIDLSTDERPSMTTRRPARVARAHPQPVASGMFIERHVCLAAVFGDAPRGLRREVEQRADRLAGRSRAFSSST